MANQDNNRRENFKFNFDLSQLSLDDFLNYLDKQLDGITKDEPKKDMDIKLSMFSDEDLKAELAAREMVQGELNKLTKVAEDKLEDLIELIADMEDDGVQLFVDGQPVLFNRVTFEVGIGSINIKFGEGWTY